MNSSNALTRTTKDLLSNKCDLKYFSSNNGVGIYNIEITYCQNSKHYLYAVNGHKYATLKT